MTAPVCGLCGQRSSQPWVITSRMMVRDPWNTVIMTIAPDGTHVPLCIDCAASNINDLCCGLCREVVYELIDDDGALS
jgi:hypothetical protein